MGNEKDNSTKIQWAYCCSIFNLVPSFVVANLPEKGRGIGWRGLSGFDIQENGSDAICRMFTMVPDRVTENKVDLFV